MAKYLLPFLIVALFATAMAEGDSPMATLQVTVERARDKTAEILTNPTKKETTRDISNAALAVLDTGGVPAQAENLLRLVFHDQDMDPKSSTYGTMHWVLGSEEVKDANSIDFGTQSWGPIFLGHSAQLSEGFKQEAQAPIQAALVALEHHHVAVSYTNIFLMNTVDTLLLSEVVKDSAQHQRALDQLATWIDYTLRNGIHEFDSPTYYAVDLNDLDIAFCHERDPALHAKFGAILDYFWEDISVNHDPGIPLSLVGAHSRDYDFLRGEGLLDDFLRVNGMLEASPSPSSDIGQVFELDNALHQGYRPGDAIKAMAGTGERLVLQRFDVDPARLRSTYITPGYAIGAANGDYSAQDKMFAADFASPKDIPSVTVVPDTLDAPYGLVKIRDRGGHDKPHHVPLHLACVQDKGTVVLLLDLNPSREKDALSFATNLILPAQADEILVEGKRVDASEPFAQVTAADAVISVHENHACLVARFFQVDPMNAVPPQFELRAEQAGLNKGAARWVVYHAREINPAATMPPQLRVGLIVQMFPWKDEQSLQAMGRQLKELRIDQQSSGGIWQVTTNVQGRKLEVAEDLVKHVQVDAKVDDHLCVALTPLSVNGRNISLQP